jgi:hypothetical protein
MCFLHVNTDNLADISSQQAQASILPGRDEVNADTSLHILKRNEGRYALHASGYQFHREVVGHAPRLSQQFVSLPWSTRCTTAAPHPNKGQRNFDVVALVRTNLHVVEQEHSDIQEQRGRRAKVALVRLEDNSWHARMRLKMSQHTG